MASAIMGRLAQQAGRGHSPISFGYSFSMVLFTVAGAILLFLYLTGRLNL